MKLHSNIIGEGKAFIILHGFLGMGDNWKTLAKEYAKLGYQVHLVDQRNHGRSPHDNDFSYALLSKDLAQYCQDHQLKNIVLLGHSMGGKTAMEFACTHADSVEKLIVADIAPKYYAPHHQNILEGLQALDFSRIHSRNDADEQLSIYIKDAGTRLFLMKNLFRKEKNSFGLRMNLPVLTEKVAEIGKALPKDRIFNKKALFVRGAQSNYIQDKDWEMILEHFPAAGLETVSNASHWLHAENPRDFFRFTSKFLQE